MKQTDEINDNGMIITKVCRFIRTRKYTGNRLYSKLVRTPLPQMSKLGIVLKEADIKQNCIQVVQIFQIIDYI